jgi:tape measure domain-containing protein
VTGAALAIVIKAKDHVSGALDGIAGKVRDMVGSSAGQVRSLATAFGTTLGGAIGGVGRALASLQGIAVTALAGWGIKSVAQGFVETASSFDRLKVSLNTVTQGKGAEWFERLNEWALKMPLSTPQAIESFIQLRAMGLQPTIEQMTTLVDTASAVGGSNVTETFAGIARALGQIQTKGKVSTEELLQLTERNVPAFEILRQKLGLSGEQIANIGHQGIEAGKAINALMEGMAERYGGQSAQMNQQWAGMVESLKALWQDFQRMVMESGAMQALRDWLGAVVAKIDELRTNGTLKEWAEKLGQNVAEFIKKAEDAFWALIEKIKEFAANGDIDRWCANAKASFGAVIEAVKLLSKAVVGAAKGASWLHDKVMKPLDAAAERAGALKEIQEGAEDGIDVPITGSGSPRLPISQKLKVVHDEIAAWSRGVSANRPSIDADMSGVSQVPEAFQQALADQIRRVAEFQQRATAANQSARGSYYGMYAARIDNAQLAGAEAGLQRLMELMAQFGGGPQAAGGGGGATRRGASLGRAAENLNINIQAGPDTAGGATNWDTLARTKIIPALRRAGVLVAG